jgi:molybdate transport system regulatory protein
MRRPRRQGGGERRPATAIREEDSLEFQVPARVKHLGAEQLEALTKSFRGWYLQPARSGDRRARTRVWLTYLLIRFTGAKLGEVGAIEDRDIDLRRGTLKLGGGRGGRAGREVQLPPDVVEALRSYLADFGGATRAREIFGLDQGYVRRKFYERADACSIPRELASPQVLRASRALELLRGGVPLPVVQRILGQKTADLTASYVDYEPADVSHIFEAYLLDELRTRTSARNLFAGRVTRIRRAGILSEVELETAAGHRIVSVITNTSLASLGLKRGSPATGLIKAPSVDIVKSSEPPATSARNVLRGRVKAVRSDEVTAEIMVTLSGDVEVCALVTARGAERLELAEDDDVWVVFDTSAVILSVALHG